MTMAHDSRSLRVVLQGPQPDHTDPVRDSLAEHHQHLDRLCPAALDVAAQAHAALHQHLTGIASQLCGARSPDHFRQALRGERNLSIVDLAFLAVQPMSEPRAAVAAMLAVLAHEVGCRVTPTGQGAPILGSACALLIETFGVSLGAVERAREDGRIDETERPQVIAALEGLQRRVAELLEAVRQTGVRA